MKKLQRFSFWSILTISLLASVWWIFHVPHRPDRVFNAIPAAATVVSVHRNLAEECEAVFDNPMLLRVIRAGGIDETSLAELSTNKVVRQWIARLSTDQAVLAYVPAMGAGQKPALVAASWIGNQSRLLRWQMAWIKTRDLIPVYLDDGNLTIWRSRTKFGKTHLRLSLALSEGLVLACISEDPLGVRTLLEAAENYPYRHTAASRGLPAQVRGLLTGSPRHWGWFEAHHEPIAFQFEFQPEALQLEMRGTDALSVACPLKDVAGTGPAMELIGRTSDFAALLPLEWISTFIPAEPPFLLLRTLREMADPQGTPAHALALVALLDQDHNGRIRGPINKHLRALIKGVKAPTLLLGLQIQGKREAGNRINQALAKLNSQYGLELTATPFEPENGLGITSVHDNRKSFYHSFEPEERVAYVMRGDWLIIASNGSVLKKLLSQPATGGRNEWKLDSSMMPAASAWANLDGVGQTLKNVAGVAKLAAMLDSSSESQPWREVLDQSGAITGVLRELKQARLTMQSVPGGFRLNLVIGPQP